MSTTSQLPTLRPGDSHMESLIGAALQGHANTREAMRWLVRQLVPAQATQAEVTDVVVGCLPTMNQDPYPALGDWWVQLWDGPSDDAMVIARVYGASPAEANEKAETIARAILALRPERVPMTDEQINEMALQEEFLLVCDGFEELTEIVRAVEAHHGITTQAKRGTP